MHLIVANELIGVVPLRDRTQKLYNHNQTIFVPLCTIATVLIPVPFRYVTAEATRRIVRPCCSSPRKRYQLLRFDGFFAGRPISQFAS